jgi:ATP phosphoribosyltransferase
MITLKRERIDQRKEIQENEQKTAELRKQLEEVTKQRKTKDTKQRIAKHKLDEVKRNIQFGERELEKLGSEKTSEEAF